MLGQGKADMEPSPSETHLQAASHSFSLTDCTQVPPFLQEPCKTHMGQRYPVREGSS